MSKNKFSKGVITGKTKFELSENLLIIPSGLYAYASGKSNLDKLDEELG